MKKKEEEIKYYFSSNEKQKHLSNRQSCIHVQRVISSSFYFLPIIPIGWSQPYRSSIILAQPVYSSRIYFNIETGGLIFDFKAKSSSFCFFYFFMFSKKRMKKRDDNLSLECKRRLLRLIFFFFKYFMIHSYTWNKRKLSIYNSSFLFEKKKLLKMTQ